MPVKPCIVCGTLTPQTRCPAHAIRRGSTRAYRNTRAQVIAADPYCYICGEPADTVDHIIPLARGGTDDPANLRPACLSCNSRKGAR